MTKKRFRSGFAKYDEFSDEIIDELTGKHYFDSTKDDYVFSEEIVGLLNELNDENERLKQRITKLELLNDGLNHALKNIKKIDVEIDVNEKRYKVNIDHHKTSRNYVTGILDCETNILLDNHTAINNRLNEQNETIQELRNENYELYQRLKALRGDFE